MKDESKNVGRPAAGAPDIPGMPVVVDRATWQAELDALRVREKAHTREGDAIAAARQRLPMVEVDSTIEVVAGNPAEEVVCKPAFVAEGREKPCICNGRLVGQAGPGPGATSCLSLCRAVLDLFIASARGLGLTPLELALLPFFLLAVRGHAPHLTTPHADPCDDRAWLRAQWGQLALVALGVGFLVGGVTIATVGVTDVFVREDLSFLHTTASALRAVNPHLVPLIAHDRAGFGGALVSDGIAFLPAALWGIRRGVWWIW